jgi:hypothetical protein
LLSGAPNPPGHWAAAAKNGVVGLDLDAHQQEFVSPNEASGISADTVVTANEFA